MTNLLSDCFGSLFWNVKLGASHPDVRIGDRVFRILQRLGEGGYATVFLVREIPTPFRPYPEPGRFAVKKAFANAEDTLQRLEAEIATLKELAHPNLLHLIDAAIVPVTTQDHLLYEAYLLFPAYLDGTLAAELDRYASAGALLPTHTVLDIFVQLLQGLQHMHARGFCHRDVKPHNMLITRVPEPPSTSCLPDPHHDPVAPAADGGEGDDLEAPPPPPPPPQCPYEVVLMDFGSCRRIPLAITSRAEALTLQEESEAHCTATYRPPELFDVPSDCTLDGRIDVWMAGCTLYHLMYGASPFQKAIDRGGTLALAVVQGAVPWPEEADPWRYPEELHELVGRCLALDPEERPQVDVVLEDARALLAKRLKDPADAVANLPLGAKPAGAGGAKAGAAQPAPGIAPRVV